MPQSPPNDYVLESQALAPGPLSKEHGPKGPSAHYLRTLGPFWVPKTMNKDDLDP